MCSWVVRKVVKIKRSMLGCQPRSVCLGGCVLVKSILYILYTISRFRKVLLEILTDMEFVWNTKDGDIKYVFVGCAESCLKLKINFRLLAEICLPLVLSTRNEHA